MCTSKGFPFYRNRTAAGSHKFNTSFGRVVELYEELATILRSQRGGGGVSAKNRGQSHLRLGGGLSGAVYTQLADVEVECDGLVLYSREPKASGEANGGAEVLTPLQARIKAANARVLSSLK
jgi:hypothetical protein